MTPGVGISAFGAYIPRLRVDRAEIAAAHRWLRPSLGTLATAERSTCGWDEDAVTMAVEAARDCLHGIDRSLLTRLYLATTTPPYATRLNAGVVAGALGLEEASLPCDVGGSVRAGTIALLATFDAARAGETALCVASDRLRAPAATTQEQSVGHAAAAVVVGRGVPVARLLGARSLTTDFVSHFRSADAEFEYHWEERWVRETGYLQLVPPLIERLLTEAGIAADEITHFCIPSPPRIAERLASATGLPPESVRDRLAAGCGDSGAAHALLMLVDALESAQPGDRVLVVGFGEGGDALLLEATDEIEAYQKQGTGVSKWLRRRLPCTYPRYLTLNGLLKVDHGKRAEVDKAPSLSALYRHRDLVLNLRGGRCEACGVYQIPRSPVCVNPDCRAVDRQVPYSFAESLGTIASWSADHLTFTPDPPALYGMVDFDEGGRLLMDFADVGHGQIDVGLRVRMVFRIRGRDAHGFTSYFWKAALVQEEA